MLYSLLLLVFSSFASSYPFNEPKNLKSRLRRSDGVGYGYIPAADCTSPCEIYFNAITTTLTISVPAQTVTVSNAVSNPVTVTYTPITTVTTIQPSAQTLTLSDGESNYKIQPITWGSVNLQGTIDMISSDLESLHISVESEVHMVTESNPEVTYRYMNPYELENNCAYITMATLCGLTLGEFLSKYDLMQSVEGLQSNEIRRILNGLSPHNWWFEDFDPGQTIESIRNNMMNPPEGLGVCYKPDSGLGHCVVYKGGLFYDYQASDNPVGTRTANGLDIESMLFPRQVNGQWISGIIFALADS